MAKLIILDEDGELGSAGTAVWVDDDYQTKPAKAPRKTAAPAKDGEPSDDK